MKQPTFITVWCPIGLLDADNTHVGAMNGTVISVCHAKYYFPNIWQDQRHPHPNHTGDVTHNIEVFDTGIILQTCSAETNASLGTLASVCMGWMDGDGCKTGYCKQNEAIH